MNKDLIQKRFEKNLKHYNKNAFVQKNMAEHLIGMLGRKQFDNILEIGCGTGFLTRLLIKNLNFNKYIANDLANSCEDYIKKISDQIVFSPGDIENIIENCPGKYDLIISNASFQWIENIDSFLKNLSTKLNNDGVILFSTFGKENFKEIYQITGKRLEYKSINDYEKILNNLTCSFEEETIEVDFKNPKEVLNHIKNTGVNAITETVWTKKNLLEFENSYKKLYPEKTTLTYNPIYVKADKL